MEDGKVEQGIGREAGGASIKIGRIKDQQKMQKKHQWWDTDRKDGTHQRQHHITSTSYERPDTNNDNHYALCYSLRKHTQWTMRST
jgi:hypothetical protein